MTTSQRLQNRIARAMTDQVISAITRIEGRKPSPGEMREHCVRGIHINGAIEWKWKGQTVLYIEGVDTRSAGVPSPLAG